MEISYGPTLAEWLMETGDREAFGAQAAALEALWTTGKLYKSRRAEAKNAITSLGDVEGTRIKREIADAEARALLQALGDLVVSFSCVFSDAVSTMREPYESWVKFVQDERANLK